MPKSSSKPDDEQQRSGSTLDPTLYPTYSGALQRLDEATSHLGWSEEQTERLRRPESIVERTVELRMDDGSRRYLTGWRVRHNTRRGPGKGGLRFFPSVNLDIVKSLSFWMTIKCALVDLPLGGAKGGLQVDTRELSHRELEEAARSYMRTFADVVGPDIDVPAPDVGTHGEMIGWMMDEYSRMAGRRVPAVITGKPIELGGSRERNGATGLGAYYCVKELEKKKGWVPEETTIALQGLGGAGSKIVELLANDGYRLVAVSDSTGGLAAQKGMSTHAVIDAKERIGSLKDVNLRETKELGRVKRISNEELLEFDADILILAAIENMVTKENAARVKAKTIIEIANGGIASSADTILDRKKILVLPDVIVNAGGVIVSSYEWSQNRSGYYWSAERVRDELKERITSEFNQVYDMALEQNISMRLACYTRAIQRIPIP